MSCEPECSPDGQARVALPTRSTSQRRKLPRRLWAVENTAGLGNSVTQWLLNDGEQVVDVPAKLSARVRLLSST